MRKAIIAVVGVIALLAAGTAYAHMYGWGGGYGQGYGGHMWGGGPGAMWGYGANDEETQKFLDETADVRRELNEKRFELREAYRTGDKDKVEALEKELDGLRDQLREKAEESGLERGERRGYGPRAGGYGYCGGPYGW